MESTKSPAILSCTSHLGYKWEYIAHFCEVGIPCWPWRKPNRRARGIERGWQARRPRAMAVLVCVRMRVAATSNGRCMQCTASSAASCEYATTHAPNVRRECEWESTAEVRCCSTRAIISYHGPPTVWMKGSRRRFSFESGASSRDRMLANWQSLSVDAQSCPTERRESLINGTQRTPVMVRATTFPSLSCACTCMSLPDSDTSLQQSNRLLRAWKC
eukprot:6197156-Pleurochrysis_carterae.AAC.4